MPHSIYGEVHSRTALRAAFREIRRDIGAARSANALRELYGRSGYVVSLIHDPAWQERLGESIEEMRTLACEEFARSARAINRRATALDADVRVEERWSGPTHAA